jgi:iron complex outermembrane receptor protein
VVLDYELGHRTGISKRFTLDTAVFLSDYHRLQTFEPETPYFASAPAPPHLVLPNLFGNQAHGHSYGVEISAHWDVANWWRISPGFGFLQTNLSPDAGSVASLAFTSDDSPESQAQLRSAIKLRHNVEWDTSAFYVSSLRGGAEALGQVPAYVRLDTRLGWHFGESTELSVSGQNLLTPRHLEFLDGLQVTPSESARAIVARMAWRF